MSAHNNIGFVAHEARTIKALLTKIYKTARCMMRAFVN